MMYFSDTETFSPLNTRILPTAFNERVYVSVSLVIKSITKNTHNLK